MRRRRSTGLAALLLLSAAPAAAQLAEIPAAEVFAPRPYQAPTLTRAPMTLDDAVLLTLRHNPQLHSGTQRIRDARGRLQEARGLDYGSAVMRS